MLIKYTGSDSGNRDILLVCEREAFDVDQNFFLLINLF